MKKDTKLYKVTIGYVDKEGGDQYNMTGRNVLAVDVPEAVKKTKLSKNEYVQEVEIIGTVDVQ